MTESVGGIFIIKPNISEINWDESFLIANQENKDKFELWIIDLKTGNTYGPLLKDEYLKYREEFDIKLELKSVNEITP